MVRISGAGQKALNVRKRNETKKKNPTVKNYTPGPPVDMSTVTFFTYSQSKCEIKFKINLQRKYWGIASGVIHHGVAVDGEKMELIVAE